MMWGMGRGIWDAEPNINASFALFYHCLSLLSLQIRVDHLPAQKGV